MAKDYLLRLVSSDDHNCSAGELVELVKTHGTDRYKTDKKQIFDDFYAQHSVDFFAERVGESSLENALTRMAKDFPQKTLGDRAQAIHPDVAIVYDASKCKMIKNVYDGNEESDCYQFVTTPLDALIEVRTL